MHDNQWNFCDAIRATGLEPPEVIEPGKVHRFPGINKRPGNRAGWCLLFADGLGGCFGDWSSGLFETWQAKRERPLSSAERAAFAQRIEAARVCAEKERNIRQSEAAHRASAIWRAAGPAPGDHPYLLRKGIQAHRTRLYKGMLVVPLMDFTGKLTSLQFIDATGSKRLLSGGRVKGCFFLLGDLGAGPVYVCEGMATGATIHQHAGLPTVCAMNAGNLLAVCSALAGPSRQITICADNDHRTPGNPGISKGREAAAAIGASLTWPESCGPDCACTDFNDVAHCDKSREVVA